MLPFRRVLCPTDFSEQSVRALLRAEELCRHFDADLLVVHVVSPVPAAEPTFMPDPGFNVDQYQDTLRDSFTNQLNDLLGRVLDPGTRRTPFVTEGDAADAIIGTARAENADLIVISTHGATGWRRLVFGSVAEKVIRHAPVPVFVVRAGERGEEHGVPSA